MPTFVLGRNRLIQSMDKLDKKGARYLVSVISQGEGRGPASSQLDTYFHDENVYRQVRDLYDDMLNILKQAEYFRSIQLEKELNVQVEETIVAELAQVEVELEALNKRYPKVQSRMKRVQSQFDELEEKHRELDALADSKFLELIQVQNRVEQTGLTPETANAQRLIDWYNEVMERGFGNVDLDSLTDMDWQQYIIGPAVNTLDWLRDEHAHELIDIRLDEAVEDAVAAILRPMYDDATYIEAYLSEDGQEEFRTRRGLLHDTMEKHLLTLMLIAPESKSAIHRALTWLQARGSDDLYIVLLFDIFATWVFDIGFFPRSSLRDLVDMYLYSDPFVPPHEFAERGRHVHMPTQQLLERAEYAATLDFIRTELDERLLELNLNEEERDLVKLTARHWAANEAKRQREMARLG